jgi:ABC-2 type transport system permease protein
MAILLPLMLMALFVYVFGGAIDRSGHYVNYVVPGIVLLCVGFGAASTALPVAADMNDGMIDRLRSMPIHSAAVLTGHVVASVVRNALSTVLVVAAAIAYLSSAFVDPSTMPGPLRAVSEHQPITPVTETARGLLTGTAIGHDGWLALGWSVGLLAVSVTVATALYRLRARR